jgi:hypothetical protein
MEPEITVEEIRKSINHSDKLTNAWDVMSLEEQKGLAKHFFRLNGVPIFKPEFLAEHCSPEMVERVMPDYLQRINAFQN